MFEGLFKNEYERTRELVQNPDWYLEFGKVRKARLLGLGAVQAAFSGNITEAAQHARLQTFDIFEQLLNSHEVRIGNPEHDELDNHDEEREPISQIVIHHSSRAEGISLSALNALHFLNLYVSRYRLKHKPILNSKGEYQPIYSGHFNEAGEQVFYGYHWKVAKDGQSTRLLNDSAIGWQAGDWEINKRSIGICIDDDLEHTFPTAESLQSVAEIISTHYPSLLPTDKTILGHNEASKSGTACPGDKFIGGWKLQLLDKISL